MTSISLTLRQARYELLAFRRNPASVFFTFVFPLMFLVIFNLVFGNEEIEVRGGTVDASTFYVPAIVALSVISACYTNIAMSLSFARDRGQLKRVRGTPLPAAAFFVGRILQATVISITLVVLVLAIGTIFYGVDLPSARAPAFLLALIIGAAAFCSLGIALTAVIPTADAAPAVVNASVLLTLCFSFPTSSYRRKMRPAGSGTSRRSFRSSALRRSAARRLRSLPNRQRLSWCLRVRRERPACHGRSGA